MVNFLEVCDIQGGTQPPKKDWSLEEKEGFIRMLQIRDFTQSREDKKEFVKDKSTLKKCKNDDILIGRYGASIGKILTGLEGAYNVAIVKTIPDESKLNKRYLYYYLNTKYFQNFIQNAGSRAAQAGFNKSELKELQIPLPPLATQKAIAEKLDKADALRKKNQELLKQYDELAQSIFIDMFGDPVQNEKGWDLINFEEVLKLKRGYDLPVQDRNQNGNIPVYGSNGILDYHTISKTNKPCIVTGRSGTIGKVHRTEQNCWPLNTTLYSYEIYDNNITYLEYLLNNLRIDRFAHGAGVPTLDRKIVHKEFIPNIKVELQNQFAEKIKNIEAQKELVKKQAEASENLFQALLQESFNFS